MDETKTGWINGAMGMLIFSGSLPATRVAVEGFDPIFLTLARACAAGAAAALLLSLFRGVRPTRRDLAPLALVSVGCVIGFPLLSALAVQQTTSAHALVFIGLMPMATAAFATIRGGERPPAAFWFCALLGGVLVSGFALSQGGGASSAGDLPMLGAVLLGGLGYAEGGALARRLGGWRVISWALVLSLPITLPLAVLTAPTTVAGVTAPAWAGFAYVSLFSMLIGFVFWYRGLALGGAAAVGQLQLLQPFAGFALAALLLGEAVSASMIVVAFAVTLCVAGAKAYAARARPARS